MSNHSNTKKQKFTPFKNTDREIKSIKEGYTSSKYLNKTYTSKSKNKIRVGSNKKIREFKKRNDNLTLSIELDNNLVNSIDEKLSDSLTEKYLNYDDIKICDFININEDKIDDWILL